MIPFQKYGIFKAFLKIKFPGISARQKFKSNKVAYTGIIKHKKKQNIALHFTSLTIFGAKREAGYKYDLGFRLDLQKWAEEVWESRSHKKDPQLPKGLFFYKSNLSDLSNTLYPDNEIFKDVKYLYFAEIEKVFNLYPSTFENLQVLHLQDIHYHNLKFPETKVPGKFLEGLKKLDIKDEENGKLFINDIFGFPKLRMIRIDFGELDKLQERPTLEFFGHLLAAIYKKGDKNFILVLGNAHKLFGIIRRGIGTYREQITKVVEIMKSLVKNMIVDFRGIELNKNIDLDELTNTLLKEYGKNFSNAEKIRKIIQDKAKKVMEKFSPGKFIPTKDPSKPTKFIPYLMRDKNIAGCILTNIGISEQCKKCILKLGKGEECPLCVKVLCNKCHGGIHKNSCPLFRLILDRIIRGEEEELFLIPIIKKKESITLDQFNLVQMEILNWIRGSKVNEEIIATISNYYKDPNAKKYLDPYGNVEKNKLLKNKIKIYKKMLEMEKVEPMRKRKLPFGEPKKKRRKKEGGGIGTIEDPIKIDGDSQNSEKFTISKKYV